MHSEKGEKKLSSYTLFQFKKNNQSTGEVGEFCITWLHVVQVLPVPKQLSRSKEL